MTGSEGTQLQRPSPSLRAEQNAVMIYPIVDFEVVGTLIYNGLSGFALKRL